MDIYGYSAYQYNQSDELAKQMFAQQALASSIPYDRGATPHVMPAPSSLPWNMQGLSWGMSSPPELVQFTAQPPQNDLNTPPVIHCKRKNIEPEIEPVIPAKQLITEEKMAAHLNSLHISSSYTTHSLANSDSQIDVPMESPSVSTAVIEKVKGHTIVLSDEVRRLRDEPLLPAALIERLEKPHMSLVVWKPRENILDQLKDEDDKKEESQEDMPKRNGLLVPELTTMDVEM